MADKLPHKLPQFQPPIRGRGAVDNPSGRFEAQTREADADAYETDRVNNEIEPAPETTTFLDSSKTIVCRNDSPDIYMDATVNPYRGCEHGCIYCYARPTHEYFGLSAGIDFETKIFVKENAATLLAEKLQSPSWEPQVINFSGVTDPYQPTEKKRRITRQCLEVAAEFRNPAAIITKNHLITRDIDLFKEMAEWNGIAAFLSITSLDGALARKMEPRASQPHLRLKAVETLAKAGIQVGIMIGPVLPGLTDHEIPKILESAANAGAISAHYTMLRLPYGVKDLFQSWLAEHYPDRVNKVIHRVQDVRGGKLYDAKFGTRMTGEGLVAEQIAALFAIHKKKYGLGEKRVKLSTEHFKRNARAAQLSLF